MKLQKLLGAAVTVFLMSAGGAYATTYTIDGTITVTECKAATPCTSITNFTGDAPSVQSGTLLSISSGLPTTGEKTFFTLDPYGSSGTSNNLVNGTIQVVFSFKEYMNGSTLVGWGSLTQDATFQANYNSNGTLTCSSSTGPSDCLYWNPKGVTLNSPGDGSTYSGTGEGDHQSTTPSVTDLVTLSDGASFDVSFFDAQDWDITPGVSFTNIHPTPTPLPAALPLFAGGLSAMGLLGWRRKRKNAAALAAA
jgi:hypothetical protein